MYKELLAKLKSNLSADTSQILDGLLVELTVRGLPPSNLKQPCAEPCRPRASVRLWSIVAEKTTDFDAPSSTSGVCFMHLAERDVPRSKTLVGRWPTRRPTLCLFPRPPPMLYRVSFFHIFYPLPPPPAPPPKQNQHETLLFYFVHVLETQGHNVLVDEKSGNSRHLSIPGGPEVLDYLAGCQR